VDELVINVHHMADQVISYLDENEGFGLKYAISNEEDALLNHGGAIVKAKEHLVNEEFFILTGCDILTDLDLSAMIRDHKSGNALATLAVKDRPTSRSLMFDANYQLVGWKNNETGLTKGENLNRAVHTLGFSTIHVIRPAIYEHITEQGAFSIMDLYLRLMDNHSIKGFRHDESGWIEFGRMERIEAIRSSSEFQRMINLV
jgi:NDP-sugar pyrophosphorylase family protein